MKLWLISQTDVDGWDTYDSAVVAALTAENARITHPNGEDSLLVPSKYSNRTWTKYPDRVTVKYLGIADLGIPAGVICASFNGD